MMIKKSKRDLPALLAAAAQSYQDAHVIAHCKVCSEPCCKLDKLVLELNWRQVKTLWRLDESRTAFDKRLASGQGPTEIRAGNGLYYAHQKPCPAYDTAAQSCRVYDQPLKPGGCSDFPVYGEADSVTADLRCEAVNLTLLKAWIETALGPEFRVIQSADRDFPFLVSLSVKKTASPPRPGLR